jgi:co-chaperonin GroES (HSP10)
MKKLSPVWSRLMVERQEEKLSSIIEVVTYANNKEPLVLVKILAAGPAAGCDNTHGTRVHDFKPGQLAYVYSQSITNHVTPDGQKFSTCPDDKVCMLVESL